VAWRPRCVFASPRHRRVELRPRLERHELGPRVYFLGYRLHEWHLGVGIMVVLAVGVAAGVHDALPTLLAAAAGVWLVAKDWRDISSTRCPWTWPRRICPGRGVV
jgi:hypothetical protein